MKINAYESSYEVEKVIVRYSKSFLDGSQAAKLAKYLANTNLPVIGWSFFSILS